MDFAESQEAVAVPTIVDESCLQRWFDPGYLGEIDVTAKLSALGRFEVKLLDPISAQHHNSGFLRVGRVDEHFVGH
jgi:hypothetical protein